MHDSRQPQYKGKQVPAQKLVMTEPDAQEVIVRRQAPRSRPPTAQGLCTTCVHAATCTFPKHYDEPVLQCGEFEGEVLQADPVVAARAALRVAVEEPPADVGQMKGLCRTCSKRVSCVFPRPEGGVWHCEEYE